MKGQMRFEDWMPEACPGTKEFDEAKNIVNETVDESQKMPKKEVKKGRKKTIAENSEVILKEPQKVCIKDNRENWYALLVAILRPDVKGADDAMAAMGIKRQYNSTERTCQNASVG